MYGTLLKKLLKKWTKRKFVFLLLAGVAGTRTSATLAQSHSPQSTSATSEDIIPLPMEPSLRPNVGIRMMNLTPDLAEQINNDPEFGFQVSESSGVIILGVEPDTPATSAGFRKGDIILEVEGQPIDTSSQVQQIVANSRIGESLSFTVRRNDQKISILVRPKAQLVWDRINLEITSSQQIIEQFPELLPYSPHFVRETNKIHAYASKSQLRKGTLDSRRFMLLQRRAFDMGLQGITISALPDVDSGDFDGR